MFDNKLCDAETPRSTGRRPAPRPVLPPSGAAPAPRPGSPVHLVPRATDQDQDRNRNFLPEEEEEDTAAGRGGGVPPPPPPPGLEMAVRMNTSEAGGFKLLEEDALDDRPCAAVKKFVSSVLERKDMKDADVANSFRNLPSYPGPSHRLAYLLPNHVSKVVFYKQKQQ
ncbi:hypothetical protein RRG08_043734 [Elysia crispata]|uniref:Uncharacterized protein n=1 Tax=Elysia crispata TaxID=231223 RepID=A0AAE0ZN58_9GAST|nr:hypothetical protein RRG08_043734 [Elysia crispata]